MSNGVSPSPSPPPSRRQSISNVSGLGGNHASTCNSIKPDPSLFRETGKIKSSLFGSNTTRMLAGAALGVAVVLICSGVGAGAGIGIIVALGVFAVSVVVFGLVSGGVMVAEEIDEQLVTGVLKNEFEMQAKDSLKQRYAKEWELIKELIKKGDSTEMDKLDLCSFKKAFSDKGAELALPDRSKFAAELEKMDLSSDGPDFKAFIAGRCVNLAVGSLCDFTGGALMGAAVTSTVVFAIPVTIAGLVLGGLVVGGGLGARAVVYDVQKLMKLQIINQNSDKIQN